MDNGTLLTFNTLVLSILLMGMLFTLFRQPSIIAYLITGMVIGPYGLKLISDTQMIQLVGDFGVVILLFFVGMEICLTCLLSNWRVAIIGTLLQILISVAVVFWIGAILDLELVTRILLGFVISLSSTALVVKILEDRKELGTKV